MKLKQRWGLKRVAVSFDLLLTSEQEDGNPYQFPLLLPFMINIKEHHCKKHRFSGISIYSPAMYLYFPNCNILIVLIVNYRG